MPQGFKIIGAHACDNCHPLKNVDLSNTQIEEIQENTFVHCTSLKEVRLPKTLHTIRVKAFVNCAALPELVPPSLKYIASQAFLDCTAFKRLVKLPGRHNFFHEYGRRVGMVPRSSLKEGKNNQMVEKRARTPKPNQKTNTPKPTGRVSTIL